LIDENPLKNFKVLYGNGAVRLDDETGEPGRVGGVRWTIKDGIVYDAKQLLSDVRAMVEQQKKDFQNKAEVKAEDETKPAVIPAVQPETKGAGTEVESSGEDKRERAGKF